MRTRSKGSLLKSLLGVLATLHLGTIAPGVAQGQNKPSGHEQSVFGADAPSLDRPVPLPQGALDALRKALATGPNELPAEWLRTSAIHLNGLTETDLVVIGRGAGHAVPFYILRPTSHGYKVILNSGGDSLRVLRTRSNGYRDLQLEGFAAGTTTKDIYKFDGESYVKGSERTRPIE